MIIAKTKSKVEQVQARMRALIHSGKAKPGYRFPPESEMAKRFGVSRVTLNRALAGLAHEQLLDRTQGRGTFVRQDVCRGLIVFVFPLVLLTAKASASPFFGILMNRLQKLFKARQFQAHCVLGDGDTEAEFVDSLHLDSPLWRQAAAVVTSGRVPQLEKELLRRRCRVVCLGEPTPRTPSVEFDYASLGRQATQHLLARGYRRLGIVCRTACAPGEKLSPAHDGFAEALAAAGYQPRPEWCLFTHGETVLDGLTRILALRERPDALVITDDMTALEVERVLLAKGVQVPGDLALITHATQGVDMPFVLPFTTCRFKVDRFARAVYGVVDRLARGEALPPPVRVRPRIIQGETT